MTRRKPVFLDDDEDNLFDSIIDAEEEFLDGPDDIPNYEDPAEIEKMIAEELSAPKRRRRKRRVTK